MENQINEFLANFARQEAAIMSEFEVDPGVMACDVAKFRQEYAPIVTEMRDSLDEFQCKLNIANAPQSFIMKVWSLSEEVDTGYSIDIKTDWLETPIYIRVTKEQVESGVIMIGERWVECGIVFGYYSHSDGPEGLMAIKNKAGRKFSGLIGSRINAASMTGNDELLKVRSQEEIMFGKAADYNLTWCDLGESHIKLQRAAGDLAYEKAEIRVYRTGSEDESMYVMNLVWDKIIAAKIYAQLVNAVQGVLVPATYSRMNWSPYLKFLAVKADRSYLHKVWIFKYGSISQSVRSKMWAVYNSKKERFMHYRERGAKVIQIIKACGVLGIRFDLNERIPNADIAEGVLFAARNGENKRPLSYDMYMKIRSIADPTANRIDMAQEEIMDIIEEFNLLVEAGNLADMPKDRLKKRLSLAKRDRKYWIDDKEVYRSVLKLVA